MPYHTSTDSVALLEDELKLRQDLLGLDYDELVEVIVRNHFDYPRVRDMRAKFKKENEELKNENDELKKQIKLLNEHIENLPRPHIGHMIGRNIAVQLKEAKEEIEKLKGELYEAQQEAEGFRNEYPKLEEEIKKLKAEKEAIVEAHKKKLAESFCPEPLEEDLDKAIDAIFDPLIGEFYVAKK